MIIIIIIFNEEGNPSQKIDIVDKGLDDIDINEVGNLEDLLGLVFLNEECGNLKEVD